MSEGKMRQRSDLAGKVFGKLTVLEYNSEMKKWKCQCECGNITHKSTGHLNAGAVSCGCIQRKDLVGKRFGKVFVVSKTDKRRNGSVLWQCKCVCGNVCLKTSGELQSGFEVSCGCNWRQPAVCVGDRFGRLVAICPTEQRSARSVVWECKCDCGESVNVRATSLTSGHTTSCGCAHKEKQKHFDELLTYVDNTCIEFLRKIGDTRVDTPKSTGVRGVVQKGRKYEARITFRKKFYYLGRFSQLADAVAARRRAEEVVEEYVQLYDANFQSEERIDPIEKKLRDLS